MTVKFGPLGASQILSVSGTSARTAIGALPTINPAIAITALSPLTDIHYVRLGDNTVTVDFTNGQRINLGTPDDITVVPVSNSETHVAIVSEGGPGEVLITPGSYSSDSAVFTPVGAAQILAVTNSDQRFALPTLGSTVPCFGLIGLQAQMGPCWLKLGDNTVTGSITTSMRVTPGTADEPTVIRVTNAETHVSLFCEGAPGDVMLVAGNLLSDTSQTDGRYVRKAGDTMTGTLAISVGASTGSEEYLRLIPTDFGSNKSYIAFKHGGSADIWQLLAWDGTDSNGELDLFFGTLKLNGNLVVAPASAAQGDIIYYNGTNWVRLAAGTAGQLLKTNGTSANPAWTNPGGITTIASGSFAADNSQVIATGIPATYAYLILQISGLSSNTSAIHPLIQVSTNNGSTYDTTAGNYLDFNEAGTSLLEASLTDFIDSTSAITFTSTTKILGYQGGPRMMFHSICTDSNGVPNKHIADGVYRGSTSAINAIRMIWSSTGNSDAGTYALYGVN